MSSTRACLSSPNLAPPYVLEVRRFASSVQPPQISHELRAIAIGRRNWTLGSVEDGRRAAAIYTLIAPAKLSNVDPHPRLADVLARLPAHPAKRTPGGAP
jgi:hypothetical protein